MNDAVSGSGGSALVRSLHAEARKITTTRLWWILALATVAYAALNAGLTAGFSGMTISGQPQTPDFPDPAAYRNAYAAGAFAGAYLFALVVGVTGMTSEYRYQTITATFLTVPRRWVVVVTKFVSHFALGMVFGVVGAVAALVAGGVVVSARGFDLGLGADGLWRALGLGVLAVALWAVLGLGVGTLIRNQVVAILVALLIAVIIEPLLSLGLHALDLDSVSRYLPSNASSAMTSADRGMVDLLSWWAGGLVMLAYAAVFATVGLQASVRRDIT